MASLINEVYSVWLNPRQVFDAAWMGFDKQRVYGPLDGQLERIVDAVVGTPQLAHDAVEPDSPHPGVSMLALCCLHQGMGKAVEALLARGASASAPVGLLWIWAASADGPREMLPPLHLAALHGADDAIEALAHAGADPKGVDGKGRDAITRLCLDPIDDAKAAARAVACVKALARAGCEVGPIQLGAAMRGGQPELVEALLGLGADPWGKDLEGRTPHEILLDQAFRDVGSQSGGAFARSQTFQKCLEAWLAKSGSLGEDARSGNFIEGCVALGKWGGLASAARAGADVSAPLASDGQTPLTRLVREERDLIDRKIALVALAEAGVDASPPNRDGTTALEWAAGLGIASLIPDLVRAGADPNRRGLNGLAPLDNAAKAQQGFPSEAIKELVKAGAEVDARGPQGATALHWAARRGADVLALIKAGADPSIPDARGRLPSQDLEEAMRRKSPSEEERDFVWSPMIQAVRVKREFSPSAPAGIEPPEHLVGQGLADVAQKVREARQSSAASDPKPARLGRG